LDVCNVPYLIHLLDFVGNVLFELLILIVRRKLLLWSESSKEPLPKRLGDALVELILSADKGQGLLEVELVIGEG
jgi:hypothetical protein